VLCLAARRSGGTARALSSGHVPACRTRRSLQNSTPGSNPVGVAAGLEPLR
jgi:hypothetical protein